MENTAEKLEQEVQIDDNIEQTKEQPIELNQDPVEIEAPTIIRIPLIAKKIEDDPIKETFSLR